MLSQEKTCLHREKEYTKEGKACLYNKKHSLIRISSYSINFLTLLTQNKQARGLVKESSLIKDRAEFNRRQSRVFMLTLSSIKEALTQGAQA
jgi:hypothetical protein